MGKLAERLGDATRSGVYRATRADAVLDAVRGTSLDLARISLEGASDKKQVLERIAAGLAFPQWFGANWDALEDCLSDLSWREAHGHVVLVEGSMPGDVLGILVDVLASSAEFWAANGKPFFAIFVDPQRTLGLADLFRDA